MGWQLEIKMTEEGLEIWNTGTQKNRKVFDSNNPLSDYTRRDLANYELFLREQSQAELADRIKAYLGKIIRARDCDDLLIPDGNYQTNIPLMYLKKSILTEIDELGLNLNPDFQRPHVWKMPQRVAYMEFLMKGGKSNPIYFNHEGWMGSFKGEYVIVDGKQRLTTILMFLNNDFPIFKDKDPNGVGYYAKDFDVIPNDIVFVTNALPNRELVLEWYLQMNEGNVAHTEEELDLVRDMLIDIRRAKAAPEIDNDIDIER